MSYDLDVRSDAQYSKAVPLAEMTAIVGALPGITRVTPTFYVLDRPAAGIHVNVELSYESGEAAQQPTDTINSVGLLVPYPMLEKSGPLAIELALQIAEKCGWAVYDPQSDGEVTRETVDEALASQRSSGASARELLARVIEQDDEDHEHGAAKEPALGELFNQEIWNHSLWVMIALFVLAATVSTWFMVVRGWPSEDFGKYLPWAISIGGVLLLWVKALAAALYRRSLARSFVSVGKGSFSADSVVVERITVTAAVPGYNKGEVSAAAGRKFVSFDLHIKAAGDVDPDDFQLVKRRAGTLGSEENVGSNLEDNYFFWTPLDAAGRPVESLDSSAGDVRLRFSFQVPHDAKNGYLFYWGEYVGPLEFR